ncbi:MAG TPA: hypothetical protein VGI74_20530, partial [Streptosporangiaceae bacterium]
MTELSGPERHPTELSGPERHPTAAARTPAQTAQRCTEILDEVERAVVGRRLGLELVLTGILAGGHILLEDL